MQKNGGEFQYSCKWDIRLLLHRYYSRYKLPGKSCKKWGGVGVIIIQTSIVISAKDLKLLGGVFHKIYYCKDVIWVI